MYQYTCSTKTKNITQTSLNSKGIYYLTEEGIPEQDIISG